MVESVVSCSCLWCPRFEQSQAPCPLGLGEGREPAQGPRPFPTRTGRLGRGRGQEHGLGGLAGPELTSVLAASWLS